EPEALVAADGAEVAGAEENDDLVVVVGLLDRVVEAEAGVAEVLRHLAGEVVLPVVEVARRELERLHAVRVDGAQLHDAVVVEAGVEELHLEGQLLVAPEGAIGAEADVAPLVVTELQEPVGNLPTRVLEGLRGDLLGLLGDVVQAEALATRL